MSKNGQPVADNLPVLARAAVDERGPAFGLNAEEQDLVYNILMDRARFFSDRMDVRRDVDKECGYPKYVTPDQYKDYYDRKSVPSKVVEFMPRQAFKRGPEIYDDENEDTTSPFEQFVRDLNDVFHQDQNYHEDEEGRGTLLNDFFRRVVICSRIGRYGIVLIGLNDGKALSEPVDGWNEKGSVRTTYLDKYGDDLSTPKVKGRITNKGGKLVDPPYRLTFNREMAQNYAAVSATKKPKDRINFLQCYPEAQARISAVETNEYSRRYGHPVFYQIKSDKRDLEVDALTGDRLELTQVHWSRVVHVPASGLSSDVYGIPEMQQVLSHLVALDNTYGAADAAYWKRAFDTTYFKTDPKFGASGRVNKTAIREMVYAIEQGFQKHGILEGLEPQSVGGPPADPTAFKDAHIEAICVQKDWPVPVFKGYEIGEQASENNSTHFLSNVASFQDYCTSKAIAPLFNRLIMYGLAPEPKKGKYKVKWPDLKVETEKEKADLAAVTITALAAYTQGGVEAVVPQMELWTEIFKKDADLARRLVDAAEEYAKQNPPVDEENELLAEEPELEGATDDLA